MIHFLHIRGYRSLADFSLKLAPLTVVQGTNGVGKSNRYKALRLFGSLAKGTFPQTMASEGGTHSCLWAGPVVRPPKRKEVSLDLKSVDFRWQLTFGLVPASPGDPTMFRGDPDMKKEAVSSKKIRHSRTDWTPNVPHTTSPSSPSSPITIYRSLPPAQTSNSSGTNPLSNARSTPRNSRMAPSSSSLFVALSSAQSHPHSSS
ncbi:MAG: hypothetical protein ACJAVK_000218 [Akkermansiaceae bacterium]|jgi:hypothetical protein